MLIELDLPTLALIAAVMVLGGIVKGAIGLGLPLVCVGFMSMFLPAKEVLGISVLPILITNVFQVYETGAGLSTVRRFWPMVVCMLIGLVIGAQQAASLSPSDLYAAIGSVLVLFCLTGFFRPNTVMPKSMEFPASLVAGSIAGLSGGISTVWGPPVSMYLLMTGMKKEEFVRTVGIVWCSVAFPLTLLYAYSGIIGAHNVYYSLAACAPALAGLWLGQRIRKRISQEIFRRILLATLLFIGLNLIRRSFL